MPFPNRFVADTMLGKLARWLRILGYDTLYYKEIEDYALIQIALSQQRWLLTRDTVLLRERKPAHCTLIRDDHLADQLKQVVMEFHLDVDRLLIRCLECNEELLTLSKDLAEPRVPSYVFQTQEQFSHCPNCKRVYWAGTHYQRIWERIHELFP